MGTVGEDEDKYVLGNSFLRNYYTVYDMKKQKIGITLDISNRQKQLQSDPSFFTPLVIGLIAGGATLFVIILGLIIFCIVRKRKMMKQLAGNNYKYEFKAKGDKTGDEVTLLDDQKFKHNYPVGINTGRESVDLH